MLQYHKNPSLLRPMHWAWKTIAKPAWFLQHKYSIIYGKALLRLFYTRRVSERSVLALLYRLARLGLRHASAESDCWLVKLFLFICCRFCIHSFGMRLGMAGPCIVFDFRRRREGCIRRGSIFLLIWSTRHWQSTDKQIKTRIEELKQFVSQLSEQVRSWLGPVKDVVRPGGWDWKGRCSNEHVRRDVPASVTLQS